MPSYTVGQAAELLGVSADTVRRLGRPRGPESDPDPGRAPAPRRRRAGPLRAGQVRPPSGDARSGPESARNHFPGLVTKVTKDKVMAQVEVQAGPFRVVSLISREAADELALAPGSLVVASVKATNVVVEIPNP